MTLDELLKKHGLRLTKSRQQVFNALRESSIPLAIGDITKRCPQTDRTSVYRALLTFGNLRIVNVVHIGWKNYYELAEPFIPHHHHLYCIRCMNAIPIQTPELEQLINYLSKKYNFIVTDHHFELEGICQQCQLKKSRRAKSRKPEVAGERLKATSYRQKLEKGSNRSTN